MGRSEDDPALLGGIGRDAHTCEPFRVLLRASAEQLPSWAYPAARRLCVVGASEEHRIAYDVRQPHLGEQDGRPDPDLGRMANADRHRRCPRLIREDPGRRPHATTGVAVGQRLDQPELRHRVVLVAFRVERSRTGDSRELCGRDARGQEHHEVGPLLWVPHGHREIRDDEQEVVREERECRRQQRGRATREHRDRDHRWQIRHRETRLRQQGMEQRHHWRRDRDSAGRECEPQAAARRMGPETLDHRISVRLSTSICAQQASESQPTHPRRSPG